MKVATVGLSGGHVYKLLSVLLSALTVGRRKGQITQYDIDRERITRSILLEVFVADKDNEYGIQELHRITGLPLSTLSRWLHSNNIDLALHTATDEWIVGAYERCLSCQVPSKTSTGSHSYSWA
jgi:hypothetical protein